jgi:hypothetical protein
MTADDALTEITQLTCAAQYPLLTSDDLASLVCKAQRVDGYGYPPGDPNWTPTFNIPYAVVAGWELKASKAAGDFDYSDGQMKFNRSQVTKACQDQADRYKKKLAGSAHTIAPMRSPITPIPSYPVGPVLLPTEYGQGNN